MTLLDKLAVALLHCESRFSMLMDACPGSTNLADYHIRDEAREALAAYEKIGKYPPEIKSNREWREECQELRARLAQYERDGCG